MRDDALTEQVDQGELAQSSLETVLSKL